MDKTVRVAKAIQKQRTKQVNAVYGVWVAAESVDANLSQVVVAGAALDGGDATLRFVPKGAHVTGLTTGDTVFLVGSPLLIVARVVGDITLAEL